MVRWAPPELVSAALTGDSTAVERLVAAIWPGCFRLSATVIGDWNLAQDAAQEACVIVLRKVRSLRRPAAFDSWLYRIVMRECARVRRRHKSEQRPAFERSLDTFDAATLDVWKALAALPDDLRDVTILFYIEDFTSAEIAAVLGIAHPTIRTRLTRARERLRSLLQDYRIETHATTVEVTQHAF